MTPVVNFLFKSSGPRLCEMMRKIAVRTATQEQLFNMLEYISAYYERHKCRARKLRTPQSTRSLEMDRRANIRRFSRLQGRLHRAIHGLPSDEPSWPTITFDDANKLKAGVLLSPYWKAFGACTPPQCCSHRDYCTTTTIRAASVATSAPKAHQEIYSPLRDLAK